MKTLKYCPNWAGVALLMVAIQLGWNASAQTVCPDLEIDFTQPPFNDAGTANWMDGVPISFDVVDASGANGTDGVMDITITPRVTDCSDGRFNVSLGEINNGSLSSGVGSRYQTGPNCGNIAGDMAVVQFDIVFANHLCISLSQVSEIDSRSLNGASEGYEWGAVQVLAPGGTMGYGDGITPTPILRPVAQGATPGFKDYNIDDYGHGNNPINGCDLTGCGDINGLVPDLFYNANPALVEGVSFNAAANTALFDDAVDPDNDGNTSGTGSQQDSIAGSPFTDVGVASNNFFSVAPVDGPVGGFVWTHGLILTAGNANHNINHPNHDCIGSAPINGQQANGQNTLPLANFRGLSIGSTPPTCEALPLLDLGSCATLPLPTADVIGWPVPNAGCDIVSSNFMDSAPVSAGCSQIVTRSFTFTDECGNVSPACTQQIRFQADTTPPVIDCGVLNLNADPATMELVLTTNDFLAFVSDMGDNGASSCGFSILVNGEAATTLSCLDGGNREVAVEITVIDECGNMVTETCIVNLMGCCMPNLQCPAPVNVTCLADVPPANAADATADGCAVLQILGDFDNGAKGCFGQPRIIKRVYQAVAPGVIETCEQIITIEGAPPTVVCPPNVTMPHPGSPLLNLPLFGTPGITQDCPTAP